MGRLLGSLALGQRRMKAPLFFLWFRAPFEACMVLRLRGGSASVVPERSEVVQVYAGSWIWGWRGPGRKAPALGPGWSEGSWTPPGGTLLRSFHPLQGASRFLGDLLMH